MKHVICGMGEVGTALANVIVRSSQELDCHDPQKERYADQEYDVLHVCIPWADSFIDDVQRYTRRWKTHLTIIHSTVPVGTTRKVGGNIAHSPVHGVHPNLTGGLRTFAKPVGGITPEATWQAEMLLQLCGIKTVPFSSPEATELSKIMCTTQYAWNVILCKEIAAECERLGVPFEEVYSQWNAEYNRGYTELGKPEVCRPNLTPMPGPIGGHCLIPNAKLHDCWLTETILKRNEDYK